MRVYVLLICITLLAQNISAQTCVVTIPASTPDNRFIVNGDEVVDKDTELIWQRCSMWQTGVDCDGRPSGTSWQGALQAAADERAATGKRWRLPNVKELRSIVEERCAYPTINLTIFPGVDGSGYWSASPNAYDLNKSWTVNFSFGLSATANKSYANKIRLVRDGDG